MNKATGMKTNKKTENILKDNHKKQADNRQCEKDKKQRIVAIDTLRGILLILVILFHLCYDLHYIFGVRLEFMLENGTYIFRDCFVSLLIFISGICCNLSRSNIKRGVKTLGCGLLISLVTGLVMPEEFILFGILHFFGVSMILYGLTEKVLNRWNLFTDWKRNVGTAVMLLLFALTFNVYQTDIGSLTGVEGILKYLLFIAGFRTGCFSADYYPLMPWMFMFFAGGIAGRGIKEKSLLKPFYKDYCPPVTWIGKHTLWIYLIHQPVMYGILYVVFVILK